ncbi:MAG: hypothetical protein KAJ40_02955 [Alphaproteobacteria bacterium]|nr:hypothetical protein [Alphaproteobacteria bacterium]
MSNFTRSILYSTTVLAMGLVAMFALYNSVIISPDGASVAQISPATGDSDLGIVYDSDTSDASNMEEAVSSSDIQNVVDPATQGLADEINSAIDGSR